MQYCGTSKGRHEGVTFVDLALDVLVFPDGKLKVLDKDEFEKLDLTQEQKKKSLEAVEELKKIFQPPITFGIGFPRNGKRRSDLNPSFLSSDLYANQVCICRRRFGSTIPELRIRQSLPGRASTQMITAKITGSK